MDFDGGSQAADRTLCFDDAICAGLDGQAASEFDTPFAVGSDSGVFLGKERPARGHLTRWETISNCVLVSEDINI